VSARMARYMTPRANLKGKGRLIDKGKPANSAAILTDTPPGNGLYILKVFRAMCNASGIVSRTALRE
jgi:hypothetical protein